MTVAVAIMSLVSISFFRMIQWDNKRVAGQRVGTSFLPYAKALADYVQVYQQQLVNGTPVAGVAVPLAPTIAELRTLAIFPTTYPTTIPSNGGNPIYRIARIPTGCIGTACDLEYFAGNSVPELSPNGSVNEDLLSTAAAAIGSTAGYSNNIAPGTISGNGGWSYPNPNGAVGGIFGVYTTYSQSVSSLFVRIGDSRDPALAGNLTVANGTVAAGTITSGPISASILSVVGDAAAGKLNLNDTVTEGAVCSPNGSISKNSLGALLNCRSGLWRAMNFCEPYAGDLNALEKSGCWNGVTLANAPSGSTEWFFVEVMRHYNTANFYTGQRATGMTGAVAGMSWTRNQQSNSSGTGWSSWNKSVTTDAAGTAAVTAIQLDTLVTIGAACVSSGTSTTIRAISDGSGGGIATCVNNKWQSVKTYGTIGANCPADGVQSNSFTDGTALICKSGIMMRVSDLLSNFVLMQTHLVSDGSFVTKPTCGQLGVSGVGQPLAILVGQTESSADAVFNRQTYDTTVASVPSWGVTMRDAAGNALGNGLLKAYCYY